MDRKEFIRSCGVSCLGLLISPALLQSCAGTKYVDATIEGNEMIVPVSAFEIMKDNTTQYRKYIVLQNDSLEYPICVYRLTADIYHALWMKCTHQGTELHVYGNKLQCPAHGSEFTNTGAVQNGPAADHLRTFAVARNENSLKILLT